MLAKPRYLLIMACSQRKRAEANLLPALERYDGPPFRLLRRFLREQQPASLDIYILSAKFGLIPSNQLIPNYDQRMTLLRAQELRSTIIAELEYIFSIQSYQELLLCMGQSYLQAIDGYTTLVPPELTVRTTTGSPGKKLADLHGWLYKKIAMHYCEQPARAFQGRAKLRGVEIAMTREDVLDIARRSLTKGPEDSTNYQAWYVSVDGKRVAPKWLVSQLTGLSVSSFVSEEARRVLEQLGVEVKHL